jgi:hypothetical protein
MMENVEAEFQGRVIQNDDLYRALECGLKSPFEIKGSVEAIGRSPLVLTREVDGNVHITRLTRARLRHRPKQIGKRHIRLRREDLVQDLRQLRGHQGAPGRTCIKTVHV